LHHLGCVFDGNGENGGGKGGRCVRRGRRTRKEEVKETSVYDVSDVQKMCVECRQWGEGRNGGALVRRVHALIFSRTKPLAKR
jgi:hypothetical protein